MFQSVLKESPILETTEVLHGQQPGIKIHCSDILHSTPPMICGITACVFTALKM